jgi:hypothetical protein
MSVRTPRTAPAHKRRKKPATKWAQVKASSGDHLRKILDNTDMAQLVLAHVSAEHLCLCSMVSRSLKSFVDKLCPLQETFARDLRWWGGLNRIGGEHVTLDKEEGRLRLTVTHTEPCRQILWQLNMLPMKGAKVHMRMQLLIPMDDSVVISGDPDRVQKCMTRKQISIDVTIWKVNRVHRPPDHDRVHRPPDHDPVNHFLGPLGSVTLCVSDYICNDSRLRCTIKYPILVTFKNVPVANPSGRTLSWRMLWAMRGTIMCMHCHNRTPNFTSCDVDQADHRSICKTCYDLLYVREEQLARKWQIAQLSVKGVPRALFVDHLLGCVSYARPCTPMRSLLKSNIARHFGCDSWVDFIKNNHTRWTPARRRVKKSRFGFGNRWF